MDQISRKTVNTLRWLWLVSVVIMAITELIGVTEDSSGGFIGVIIVGGFTLWVWMRLLRSYDEVIGEARYQEWELQRVQAQMDMQPEPAEKAEKLQALRAVATQMETQIARLEHSIRAAVQASGLSPEELLAETGGERVSPGFGLAEGYVQCANPACREVQRGGRETCWRCGAQL